MKNKSADSSGKETNQKMNSNSSKTLSNAEKKYRNSVKYKKLQQQKLIKKVSIISAIAVVVLVIATIAIYYAYQSMYGHIMTIDGQKVSTSEFELLNTVNLTGDKQEVLDILKEYRVVDNKAAEMGLSLTESEKETAKAEVSEFKSYIQSYSMNVPNASEESYIRILGIGTLYSKLKDEVTKDYVIDEEEFKTALEDYRVNGKQYYINTQMKYVLNTTEEAAVFAREMLATGMEVDEVIINYSEAYNEEAGIELISLSQITLEPEDVEKILALDVSEYSDVIKIGENFAFFIIDQITVPTDEELETSYRETFANQQTTDIFYAEVDKWVAEANIAVNQRVFDSFE